MTQLSKKSYDNIVAKTNKSFSITSITEKINSVITKTERQYTIIMSRFNKILELITVTMSSGKIRFSTVITIIPEVFKYITSTLQAGKIRFSASIQRVVVAVLSDYDGETLATLDSMTLSEMDYTIL